MKGSRHGQEQIIWILKGLGDENHRLKTLVAELALDHRASKDALSRKW